MVLKGVDLPQVDLFQSYAQLSSSIDARGYSLKDEVVNTSEVNTGSISSRENFME